MGKGKTEQLSKDIIQDRIKDSLAIRESYVPEKFGSPNTKTAILSLNL